MSGRACFACLTLVAASACGPDKTPAPPASTQAPPPANVVTFIARDYGFEGPAQIHAGSTVFRLDNHGKELHHLVIVRLDQGRTYDSLLAALKKPGPPPAWMYLAGGPNAAAPNAGTNATMKLIEGHYAVLCLIPSADGVPHMAKGMIAPLEVTAGSGPPAREVAADITIKLTDYGFDLSSPLTPGNHVIRVENAGPQPHEARTGPPRARQDGERHQGVGSRRREGTSAGEPGRRHCPHDGGRERAVQRRADAR